jgi:hypothetical protein
MAPNDNPEPPPPDPMSWERRVSQPPKLNDQSGALPLWVRPFAKPEVERRAASLPMSVVLTQVAMPSAFVVSLVINALLDVPLRWMLFSVPATTIIGILLILGIFGAAELIGWYSGYRPARVSWKLSGEHTADALASELERAAKASGFTVVWSKDHTFVATRNIEHGSRHLGSQKPEDAPLRLSLLAARRNDAVRTLKVGVHAICFWEAGETELLSTLASNLVHEAAKREPWIAATSTKP